MSRYLPLALVLLLSGAAYGEMIEIDSVGHYVPLNDPDMIELGKGNEAYHGYRRHITAVGKDGGTESRWCIGTNVMADNHLSFGAGHCTTIDQDGDAYWSWFQVRKRGGFDWQVMGGTGKYERATGSGESLVVEFFPDGTATLEIKGTIELAGD